MRIPAFGPRSESASSKERRSQVRQLIEHRSEISSTDNGNVDVPIGDAIENRRAKPLVLFNGEIDARKKYIRAEVLAGSQLNISGCATQFCDQSCYYSRS